MIHLKKLAILACLFAANIHALEPFNYEEPYTGYASTKPTELGTEEQFAARIAATLQQLKNANKQHHAIELNVKQIPLLRALHEKGYSLCVNGKTIIATQFFGKGENKYPSGPSHIAGAGVLVRNKNGKFLFTKEMIRGELRTKAPGGKVERGQFSIDAARREVLEETGVEIGEHLQSEVLCWTENHDSGTHKASNWFPMWFVQLDSDPVAVADGKEVDKTGWKSLDELEKDPAITTDMKNAIASYKNKGKILVPHKLKDDKGNIVKCVIAPRGTPLKS